MHRNLLSPVKIGSLELPNRIAMAPMGLDLVEADGKVREPTLAYYEERARGGAGLLITENTSACYPRGANSAHEIGVSSDDFLPGLTALADTVHKAGSRIAIQLAHHGKVGRLDTLQGRELLMPSKPRKPRMPSGPLDLTLEEMGLMAKAAGSEGKPRVHEATKQDLEALASDFADAALRAKRAGFDAIEIHGAHGYIFSEFHSPAWNFREDEYGGSVENRARLLCEVVRACRAVVGADFPLWARIDAIEFGVDNGIVPEDAGRIAELLEEAGVDAVHVSAYSDPIGAGFTLGPIVHKPSGFVDYAASIKQRVNVPVIVSGRIEPEAGDRVIRDGKADVISMGRKLLADPELPRKLSEDRPEDVRPCIYCYICVAQPFFDRKVRCAVNAMAANEVDHAALMREQTKAPKRVLVVGGGPAGLEAASVAVQRGHDVVLCEKGALLGGTLRFAALPYEPNEHLLDFLETRVSKLPVDVRLECEVTPDLIREIAPDVVLAAVGPRRETPEIPGVDLDHVFDGDALRDLLTGSGDSNAEAKLSLTGRLAVRAGRMTGLTEDPAVLRKASKAYMPLGKRVAIVGGGLVGCELAEFLLERGREVHVFDREGVFGQQMAHPRRWRVLHDLREDGAHLHPETEIIEITPDAVHFSGLAEGAERQTVGADSVVIAEGLTGNPETVASFESAGVPVVVIGDASGVGYLDGAIEEGFRAAIDLG
ncbi:MAG: FAD-dependent oxidoreductase [Myxococcota bacterium]|jgi:2,4-dienoyl-CoA reductase (NADPH2)|nr:FAD-dependent oxidoreductase [Myxococcota bacterium]